MLQHSVADAAWSIPRYGGEQQVSAASKLSTHAHKKVQGGNAHAVQKQRTGVKKDIVDLW